MQRALLQYDKKENRRLVEKALKLSNRTDLIGDGSGCLIRANGYNKKNNLQGDNNENIRRKNGVGKNKRRVGGRSYKNEGSRKSSGTGSNNRR